MKKTIIILTVVMLVLPIMAMALPLAGWRSSAYGYQTASPPSYWINVANDISSKFPGTSPGGIWLVGETDGDPATGTILYMPSSGTYSNIRFEGGDIAEPYLTAFDSAGIKVILQVEPMNANVSTLIDIVMNRYKSHPSVIGFGIDNEWYKTCSEGCKATAAEVASWDSQLHSINPNYTLMIKHFDESKLPTGIPADILVVDDDEDNGNLNTLVSEHVSMASTYPNNPYGAQYGYPSDQGIWGSMQDPVKEIGDAIKDALSPRAISVFWVDFSIQTVYPPSTWDSCASNCTSECTSKSCSDFPDQCGSFSDGCGGNITCDSCTGGKTCVNNSCQAQSCAPATCSSLGRTCGSYDDGCGGVLNCGSCPSVHVSSGGGGSYSSPCKLKTCANYSGLCGAFIDGCGGSITCSCQSGSCVKGICKQSCNPKSCSNFTNQCGQINDGCGGNLTCGCPANKTCDSGICISICTPNWTCGACQNGTSQCTDGCENSRTDQCISDAPNSSVDFLKESIVAVLSWLVYPWNILFRFP